MRRIKKRTFAGVICEQEIFNISDKADIKKADYRPPRFKDDFEREQHKIAISRKKHARAFNANFSPASLYSTLTLDNLNEVHEFKDMKRLRDLFVRRLKYICPDAVIFAYIGRGKNTHRFHMHMVSNGIPEQIIREKWLYGTVLRIVNLREHNFYNGKDCGQDYTGLANYLFDHWTPEQGGHRWKQTKNAPAPQSEAPTVVKRLYTPDKPPRAPKGYVLVEVKSTSYGYLYFKYVKQLSQNKARHKQKAT